MWEETILAALSAVTERGRRRVRGVRRPRHGASARKWLEKTYHRTQTIHRQVYSEAQISDLRGRLDIVIFGTDISCIVST